MYAVAKTNRQIEHEIARNKNKCSKKDLIKTTRGSKIMTINTNICLVCCGSRRAKSYGVQKRNN
jgi:hypothetical protein